MDKTFKKVLRFKLTWDEETNVWYCESKDIPLFLESESFDTLIDRIKIAAPDYMEHEGNYNGPLEIHFITRRVDSVEIDVRAS
jgi:hypothetical protein